MKFLQLKENLKKEIKSCYTISGNDSFLCDRAVEILKSFCVREFADFNFVKFDALKIALKDIEPIVSTLPIGDDIRLVILYNVTVNDELKKMLHKYLKISAKNNGICVVLFNPLGALTEAENINCDKLDKFSTEKWILNFIKNYNLNIEQNALDLIIETSNCDLTYLNNELKKIADYCTNSGKITIENARQLLTPNVSYYTYNLTNAIDNKKIKDIVSIVNSLAAKDAAGDIYSYLGSYFRRMFYCAVSNQTDAELSEILKVKPYAIKKCRENVAKNSKQYYIDFYQKFTQIDADIKMGKISANNALFKLLVS